MTALDYLLAVLRTGLFLLVMLPVMLVAFLLAFAFFAITAPTSAYAEICRTARLRNILRKARRK